MCRYARFLVLAGVVLVGLGVAWSVHAAESKAAAPTVAAEESDAAVIDLFEGIGAGSIVAKVIPRSEKHVNLLLENKTSAPVVVSIPSAVALVPVMAQFDGFQLMDGNQNQSQRSQKVAATPPWQNGQNQRNRNQGNPWNLPPGAFFSVPPENTIKVGLTGVCLDHGLPSPRPKMPYELRPIHEVAIRPEVAALCTMLGKGEVDQQTAQLAAWHFQNKINWEDMAAISKKTAVGPRPKYTPAEIQSAKETASAAEKLAKEMLSPQPPASESAVSMR
ncbi:MAG: hypothetical protein U1E05_11335 [Patescibacteria group bacterium]|nr:hypothetical protein [Patescibacteria group bacterium]